MSKPDWTEAPEGATHYDTLADVFCNVCGWSENFRYHEFFGQDGWGTDRHTPRPVKPATAAWDGTGFPPVGTVCEGVWLEMPDGGDRDFEGMIIKGYYKKQVWFCTTSGENITHLTENVDFRPTRTQAQREWTGTGHPSVGTECEVLDSVNGKWNSVQITAVSRDHLVVIFNGEEALLKKNCQFRPIRSQNRDKWGRGIDFLAEMVLSGNVLLDSKFLGEQARNAASYFYNPKAMIRDQSQREKGWIVGRAAVALQEAHGLTPKAYQKYCLTLYGAGMLRRAGE